MGQTIELPWLSRRTLRNPPITYPSRRRARSGLGTSNCHRDEPVTLLFDAALLDPAAAWVLDALRHRAAGLVFWGRTTQSVRRLPFPAYGVDEPRTPSRWLNDLVADWRDGTRWCPACSHVATRLGASADWIAL